MKHYLGHFTSMNFTNLVQSLAMNTSKDQHLPIAG